MTTLIDYRGLQVVSPDPTGDGGLAIQDNFKNLVDWNPKGVWSQSASPTSTDDNTQEYYPGSLWLRTDTTPPQLYVCKSSTVGAAVWLPVLLNVVQDTSPKLGGDLDVNTFKIKDASAVTIAVAGNSVATVTPSTIQIQGDTLIGTTTTPSGATFNIAVGGGSTSPVLGAATPDIVSLAAVDKTAGDRRLYIQSELGSAISLGNNRLNFAASTGIVSIGGTDIAQFTATKLSLINASAANDTTVPSLTCLIGTDGTLGPLQVNVGGRPSATGGNRYGTIYCGDNVTMRPLLINGNAAATSYGNVWLGTNSAAATARLESRATSGPQLILSYDGSNYATFQAGSSGLMTVGSVSGGVANAGAVIFPVQGYFNKVYTDHGNGATILSAGSTTNIITADSTNILYGINNDTRLNQNGFNGTNSVSTVAAQRCVAYVTGSSGTVGLLSGLLSQVGNTGAGTLTTAYSINIQSALNSGGGTLANWVGINIGPSTAATNIYGILSAIAAAANRWNLYLSGTAANYLNGTILLGTTTIPTNATFNLVLGGGTTTPVLGAATADMVSLAAVDKAAGDRRLYIRPESGSAISLGNDRLDFAAATGVLSIDGADIIGLSSSGATLSDAMNIAVGSTTGTKIGTSTAQKLGFWNAAPVVQYAATGTSIGFSSGTGTAVNSVSTFTGNVGSSAYTIGDIVAALKKCGLMAS